MIGLVLALGQWILPDPFHRGHDGSPTTSSAGLRVVGQPTVRDLKGIKAKLYNIATEKTTTGAVDASAVDIVLQNTGERPALITSAELTFRGVVELQGCFGGGPLAISGAYDIKVPNNAAAKATQFAVRDERPFTVAPNAYDRLAVSVGPSGEGEGAWPWIYQADLTLREDSGEQVRVGRFVLLAPPKLRFILGTIGAGGDGGYSAACIRENAAQVHQALAADGIKDPALTQLAKGLLDRGYIPATGPPSAEPNPLWPVNWMKVTAHDADCSVPGMGVELAWPVQAHDVTGDGVQDSFVPVECWTGDASSFTQLEVFDGASSPTKLRRLGILTEIPRHTVPYEQAAKTSMKVGSVTFTGRSVTITGRTYQPTDATACPSIAVTQTATWNGDKFTLGQQARHAATTCS